MKKIQLSKNIKEFVFVTKLERIVFKIVLTKELVVAFSVGHIKMSQW